MVVALNHGEYITVKFMQDQLTRFRSGKMLNCEQHTCPHRCHQLQDHSKMACGAIVTSKCLKGHTIKRKCHDKAAASCRKCDAETRQQEIKRRRDHKLDQERQARQTAYAMKLAEIQDEIDHEKRLLKDRQDEQDRENTLAQKRQDLTHIKDRTQNLARVPIPHSSKAQPISSNPQSNLKARSSTTKSQASTTTPTEVRKDGKAMDLATKGSADQSDQDRSESKDDWKWQKKFEGAENDALDSLMDMIGKPST